MQRYYRIIILKIRRLFKGIGERKKKGGAALWIILLAFRLKNLSFYTEKRERG